MLDIKLLRKNIHQIAKLLRRKGFVLDVEQFNTLEKKRKQLQIETENLQNQRNIQAKKIGQAKMLGEDMTDLLKSTEGLTQALKNAENQLAELLQQMNAFLENIPNIPDDTVPEGKSEADNQEIRRWGEPRQCDFLMKDHVDLGQNLGLLDFDSAAKITGARFVVMKGDLVKLHRALIQFMIDVHTQEHGYQEIYVPYIVNSDSLFGTGQLPKFARDQFKIDLGCFDELKKKRQDLYLIPTAEVPVTNMARDKIFTKDQLPQQWVCHTPCFRSEAGAYGKDTRGMIRQHQFEKVELVHLTTPENAEKAHEALTFHAEKILQKLNLPYRVVLLCTGDMGFGATKTYDLEVWLPAQQKYREISSCSHMGAFQARRLNARYRNQNNQNDFIHTLNGSGLAVGRTLVAILENYQDARGNIIIPDVLQAYMAGMKIIQKLS